MGRLFECKGKRVMVTGYLIETPSPPNHRGEGVSPPKRRREERGGRTGHCDQLLTIPPGGDLFSHPVARAVSSALRRFTSVFGMGTGGAASLEPPGSICNSASMNYFSQSDKAIQEIGQGHSIAGKSPRPSGRSGNPDPNLGLAAFRGTEIGICPWVPVATGTTSGGGFSN